MVWGSISIDTALESMVFNEGSVTAQRYINEILPLIESIQINKPDLIFQQDNARIHIAKIVKERFQQIGLTVID